MKYFLFLGLTGILILNGCSQGSEANKNENRIMLSFDAGKSKPVKMRYDFTVNALTTGNRTHFAMELSGEAETRDKDNIEIELRNDKITMDGLIGGKQMSFTAGTKDSVPNDVAMVLTPVFSLLNRKFKSSYDSRMHRNSEVMLTDDGIDSSENKMQFFVRYPDSTVAVGDSWERELIIKSNNKMNCSAKYTLKEVKDGKATITMSGKLTGKGESFGHEFTIDGSLSGTILSDVKNGWPLDTDIKEEFILDLSGQKIKMEYLIKHTVDLQ